MLWVALYLPHLGLEVFRPAHAFASSRAVVLVDDQRIAVINQAAEQAGIQVGSNLATAYSLQADLEHYTRDQSAEQQCLQELIGTVYHFSPAVSIAWPAALLLEVAGSLNLFKGLPCLMQQLQHRMVRCGHRVQLGTAHTPHAALVLAKANVTHAWPDFPQPDEIKQVAEQLLYKAPLRSADLPNPVLERLENMGVHNVGELLDLPRHELSARFKAEFMLYLGKLSGTIADIRPWEEPTEKFVAEQHLLEPVRDKGTLLQLMVTLVEELSTWLNGKFLGVQGLRWGFATFEQTGVTMELSFAEPQANADDILALTELKYDDLELPADVMSVRIEAVKVASLARRSQHQRDLFGERPMQSHAPTELLDRLAVKLGKEALCSLNQLDDHRPEYAWSAAFPTKTQRRGESAVTPGKRPLWLLEPPQRVQLKHFEILTQSERIEGGWWEQPLARDYVVARHESGTICWLYQDVSGWYQHGYFA